MEMSFGGPSMMFSFMPIIFFIFFGLIVIIILSRLVNVGVQKTKSKETVGARIISKRQHVWGSERSRTSYYATFELESGERVEYNVPSSEIGYLVEGDVGMLTYQGTLFVAFSRQVDYAAYD
jgi:hypothetical protein